MKAQVQTLDAKADGEVTLDKAVFGVEPRADISVSYTHLTLPTTERV